MDWFTILIVLLFIVFPLIQQMLEARNRGNAPPPEEMDGNSDEYAGGEDEPGNEPMGLPDGWTWGDSYETPEKVEAPAPVRPPAPMGGSRMPEHVPRPQSEPAHASRMPQHLPRSQGEPAHASRMPQHLPRSQGEPVQARRIPDHIPRQGAEPGPSRRMPEHVPRPQAPERLSTRPAPQRPDTPVVVSLESLTPIWEEQRERRAARSAARLQVVTPKPPEALPRLLRGPEDLRRAVLLAEVLAQPRALRPHGSESPSGPI